MTATDDWPESPDQDAPPDPDSLNLDREQLAHIGERWPADLDRGDEDDRPDEDG